MLINRLAPGPSLTLESRWCYKVSGILLRHINEWIVSGEHFEISDEDIGVLDWFTREVSP